jgi:hypothetical protein
MFTAYKSKQEVLKMKNLSLLGIAVLMATMLTACGGGSAGTAGGSTPGVTQTPSDSDELILNGGRGTVNNQDTETAED